jgi:hypothetical protein
MCIRVEVMNRGGRFKGGLDIDKLLRIILGIPW